VHGDGVAPLPTRLLSFTAADGELVPAWLSDRDRPWLRDLLQSVDAAEGLPLQELERRWRAAGDDPRAGRRAAMARHVLAALLRRQAPATPMGPLRQLLFSARAAGLDRDAALAAASARFRMPAAQITGLLFADLPHARRVASPPPAIDAGRLLLLVNRALVQGLLRSAHSATLRLCGGSRALLRTAWLRGTSFRVAAHAEDHVRLEWQPGADRAAHARALASLVPLLPWARRYELRAQCRVGAAAGLLVLATGDPVLPGPEPRACDSGLERAFARDFVAAAPGWSCLREPAPLLAAGQFAFPDFELREGATGRRALLEIAGLRDPAALPKKLALLGSARHLLLCLPRRALPPALAGHPRVIAFCRRIDPAAVLAALAALPPP
jgi:predicted nuclease of restriction endonuclease-like RecB superfamily